MSHHFRAPWDHLVRAVTVGVFLLFGSLSYFAPSVITILISVTVGLLGDRDSFKFT